MSQQRSLLFHLVIAGGRLAGLEGGRRGALLAGGQLGLARASAFFLAWVSQGAAAGLRSEGFSQAHQGL